MSARQNNKRLAKRFVVTFALVGAVVAVAAAISSGSDPNGPDSSAVGSSAPAQVATSTTKAADTSSVGIEDSVPTVASTVPPTTTAGRPLPTPDLAAFCVKTAQEGATVGPVDASFNFSCVSASGVDSGPIPMDVACADEFGTPSRQVTLLKASQELRCEPSQPVFVAEPDFDAYCRHTYGSTGRASRIAIDRKGWRCVGLSNGVFQIFDVDFAAHETDLACQVTTGAETYAADDDGITDRNAPWECYDGS